MNNLFFLLFFISIFSYFITLFLCISVNNVLCAQQDLAYTVELASDRPYDHSEGLFYDVREHSLYFIDQFKEAFIKLDLETREEEVFHLGHTVTTIIAFRDEPHTFLVSKTRSLYKINWKTKRVDFLVEVEKKRFGNRFNELKCDASGRLWGGTIGLEIIRGTAAVPLQGSLYSFDSNLDCRVVIRPTSHSNGMAWSKDSTKFYFTDSEAREVYGFDFNLKKGTISNKKIVFSFWAHPLMFAPLNAPDGLTIDDEDMLWVACIGAGLVVRFEPRTGRILGTVKLPVSRVTSVCFGGKDQTSLFVASSTRGSTVARALEPLAGSVFKVDFIGRQYRGVPSARFVLNEPNGRPRSEMVNNFTN